MKKKTTSSNPTLQRRASSNPALQRRECNHKTDKRETWVLIRPIRMMYAAQPIGDLADYVNNNLGNLLERCTKCGAVRKAVIKCTDPIL